MSLKYSASMFKYAHIRVIINICLKKKKNLYDIWLQFYGNAFFFLLRKNIYNMGLYHCTVVQGQW